jgi:hypothetical protein
MNRILTLVFVFFSGLVLSQQPKVEWTKTFGGIYSDIARGIAVTPENEYIVVGTALSENFDGTDGKGFADAWVMKLDKNGKQLWKKSYGGTDDDEATTITATSDGGFLIGGDTVSKDGDIKENKGKFDVWLFKIDKNGNLLWSKTFGGTDDDYKGDAFETKDGNIIFSMVSKSNDGDFVGNGGKEDCWFFKLDKKGNIVWKKRVGGSEVDNIRKMTNIDDNTFVAVGITESNDGDFLNFTGDFTVKMDSSGNIIWAKSFEPVSGLDNILMGFEAVTLTKDKNIAAVGYNFSGTTATGRGRNNVFVVQCDTSGKVQWKQDLGGLDDDSGQDIRALPDSGLIILASTLSNNADVSGNHGSWDMWLMKLDKKGVLKWQMCLGGTKRELGGDCAIAPDNSVIIVGDTESSDVIFNKNNGRDDWAIIKIADAYTTPTQGILNIQTDMGFIDYLLLTDLSGRTLKQYKNEVTTSHFEVDCNNLLAGTYLLSIKTSSGVLNRKIVVMR